MPQKAELLLIASLLFLSLLPLAFFGEDGASPAYAEVSVDGKILRRIPLAVSAEKEEIPLETPWGRNTLTLEGGAIAVTDADCPDKLCVKMGRAHRPGSTIACLPHRLLIEIKGEEDVDDPIPAR